MKLPEGTKCAEADVLRRFARNIRPAALLRTPASAAYRRAWIDAMKRLRSLKADAQP